MTGRAVLYILAGGLISFTTVAAAECYCNRGLPVFEEDPLVLADVGLISYVTPAMVYINSTGECAVFNPEPYYEGGVRYTFFFKGDEYGQVQIYTDDFTSWKWADAAELDRWALEICEGLKLVS